MERSARLMDHTDVVGVTTEDLLVPGGRERRAARMYRPRTAGRGALVWFHGGGFVVGSLDSHDGICRALAVRSGVTILSVDYRLAPEHPFPAGLEDAAAATRWALSNAEALGLEPDRIAGRR
jgi:acetyl esterase